VRPPLKTGPRTPSGRRATRPPGRRWFRPQLEALEDRAVPGDLLLGGAFAWPELESGLDLKDEDRPARRSSALAGEDAGNRPPSGGPAGGSAAGAAPSAPASPAPRGRPSAGAAAATEADLPQLVAATSQVGGALTRGGAVRATHDGGGGGATPGPRAISGPGGHGRPALRDPDPMPIPGGEPFLNSYGPLFGGPSTELLHFYLRGPGVELSSITDFNGFIGVAVIDGVGTGTDLTTGESRELLYEVDIGFMKGVYRGEDGHFYHGTFAFL
jgi:hypothetical protein